MSILIPGMKMPKDGEYIIITQDGRACKYEEKPVETSVIELPPHGRLGDLDALYRTMNDVGWYSNADRDEVALEIVLDAKTIIPAEGGEKV